MHRVALLPFSASFPHPSTTLSYTQAANKQMQSMSTLFPSSELDKKLSDATNNEPGMPSSGLLYELGRATHRDDDYRIVTAAICMNVENELSLTLSPAEVAAWLGKVAEAHE